MNYPLVQPCATLEEWRRNRGTYIGGSDAAAILGLSPYRTSGEVWLEKVRAQDAGDLPLDPEIETRFTRWGKRLENVILDQYEEVTGFTVNRPGLTLYRHPEFPFIGGTLDGDVVTTHGDKRIVEAKSTDAFVQWRDQLWGPSGSDQVPDYYLIQLLQYLVVRLHEGFTMGDFAVLIGGNDHRIFHIAYDRELGEMLIERLIEFWSLVERREPPPFDYADKNALQLQRRIWNRVEGTSIVVPANYSVAPSMPSVLELIIEHDDAKAEMEVALARMDTAKAQLVHIAGNNAVVEIEGTGLGIVRKQKAGYHVDAYDVQPTIETSFQPRLTKKRKEILDGFRQQIVGRSNDQRIGGRRIGQRQAPQLESGAKHEHDDGDGHGVGDMALGDEGDELRRSDE